MSWFDRNRGDEPAEEAWARLGAVVDQSQVAAAMHTASGLAGLRRYVLRFEARGARVRVTGLESEALPRGGGPPDPSAFAAKVGAVESSLATLLKRFPRPFTFERGAIGVLRGGDAEIGLAFRFDEDADAYTLAELPIPTGEPNPIEDPRYVKALLAWEGRIAPVRARWLLAGREDAWTLNGARLTITGPAGNRVLGADPIALYWPQGNRFEWLVETPVGEEPPFVEPVLTTAMSGAMELAVFAAVRMKRVGVFQAEIGSEKGEILFVALRE
ncbi:MAG: hypothetical protein Q8P18_08325 [Pseudomonadota bacterium]|nr:hypothetical protein [Pseudomonadota bacterium]